MRNCEPPPNWLWNLIFKALLVLNEYLILSQHTTHPFFTLVGLILYNHGVHDQCGLLPVFLFKPNPDIWKKSLEEVFPVWLNSSATFEKELKKHEFVIYLQKDLIQLISHNAKGFFETNTHSWNETLTVRPSDVVSLHIVICSDVVCLRLWNDEI